MISPPMEYIGPKQILWGIIAATIVICLQVTIEWTRWTGRQKKYRYYIFLNSSVRGPFYPSYMGPMWQWTEAFTNRLKGNIKVVASSLVCLPEIDAGGYGPKVMMLQKMFINFERQNYPDRNVNGQCTNILLWRCI